MRILRIFVFLSEVVGLNTLALPTIASPTIEWVDQLGTGTNGIVSADGLGNIYISGHARNSLTWDYDAFIRKYDANGTVLWTEQLGTSSTEFSYGVSADGLGNVYISGWTEGNLGGSQFGQFDAFVSKYDTNGTLLWTEQLGTIHIDTSWGVSADGLGNVYISGGTAGNLDGNNAGPDDAFISKYDASGTLLWNRQLGTSSYDISQGVSADGLGNVYISGHTFGDLGGENAGLDDAFLSKYDATGELLWTEQLGTSGREYAKAVSADGLGNVYISGYALGGSLGGVVAYNSSDAFVSKYDSNGTHLWTRRRITPSVEKSYSVSADRVGNVYISGHTVDDYGGENAGDYDAFIRKYDANGTPLWTKLLGTSEREKSYGVWADAIGNIYVSGTTQGNFDEDNPVGSGVFVAKLTDSSCPAGDFDQDCDVDGSDFLEWQRGYGQAVTNPFDGADGDGNGAIDSVDLTVWERTYGLDLSPLSVAAVPEPTTCTLALATLCLAMSRRRGQAR